MSQDYDTEPKQQQPRRPPTSGRWGKFLGRGLRLLDRVLSVIERLARLFPGLW